MNLSGPSGPPVSCPPNDLRIAVTLQSQRKRNALIAELGRKKNNRAKQRVAIGSGSCAPQSLQLAPFPFPFLHTRNTHASLAPAQVVAQDTSNEVEHSFAHAKEHCLEETTTRGLSGQTTGLLEPMRNFMHRPASKSFWRWANVGRLCAEMYSPRLAVVSVKDSFTKVNTLACGGQYFQGHNGVGISKSRMHTFEALTFSSQPISVLIQLVGV